MIRGDLPMDLEAGMLISVFDPKVGPMPWFYTGDLNQDEAKIIAYKSQVSVHMMTTRFKLRTAKAVLPFFQFKKVGFVFLFQIKSSVTNEDLVASISLVVPSQYQIPFYRAIYAFQEQIRNIALNIANNFIYDGKTQLPAEIINALEEIRKKTHEQLINSKPEFQVSHAYFFVNHIKKNLDRLFIPLFSNKPLAVVSNESSLIEKGLSGIEGLAPHRFFTKNLLKEGVISEEQAKSIDLVGAPRKYINNIKSQNLTIVDMDKKEIIGPYTNSYTKRLAKAFKKAKTDEFPHVLKDSLTKLIEVANRLIDACGLMTEKERKNAVQQIQKEVKDNDMIRTAAEIASDWNPLISELITTSVANEFADWMDTGL